MLEGLRSKLHQLEPDQIKQRMREMIPDYTPYLSAPVRPLSVITDILDCRLQAEQTLRS
jgi:hypothetical protein